MRCERESVGVVLPAGSRFIGEEKEPIMRIIGLDIHRTFAEVAILEEGVISHHGRVDITYRHIERFAARLRPDDEVVVEATGNAMAVAERLRPHVGRVVVANAREVRVIAHAKIKTDKIDAAVLAQLHASGFLPEVWIPDDGTKALRRQVARRNQIVRQRTRLKNIVQSILHAHLIPKPPVADLFGKKGPAWLAEQPLPLDERLAIERHLRELDRLAGDLKVIEKDLARHALAERDVQRLMTVTGIDMTVALEISAAIGAISRFPSPDKMVSYFGLNPTVRQSGLQPAKHGRITKQGRAHARAMLVEAAWAAAKTPGPLRAFFLRIRARRGEQIAAVATARKLAVLAWHLLTKQEDYAWARPALHAKKLRDLDLKAGMPARRGQKGSAAAYSIKALRDQEKRQVEQAERAYQRFVSGWQPRGPKERHAARCTGATTERAS
jgi:transposase